MQVGDVGLPLLRLGRGDVGDLRAERAGLPRLHGRRRRGVCLQLGVGRRRAGEGGLGLCDDGFPRGDLLGADRELRRGREFESGCRLLFCRRACRRRRRPCRRGRGRRRDRWFCRCRRRRSQVASCRRGRGGPERQLVAGPVLGDSQQCQRVGVHALADRDRGRSGRRTAHRRGHHRRLPLGCALRGFHAVRALSAVRGLHGVRDLVRDDIHRGRALARKISSPRAAETACMRPRVAAMCGPE